MPVILILLMMYASVCCSLVLTHKRKVPTSEDEDEDEDCNNLTRGNISTCTQASHFVAIES
jgi:hypothetical protein